MSQEIFPGVQKEWLRLVLYHVRITANGELLDIATAFAHADEVIKQRHLAECEWCRGKANGPSFTSRGGTGATRAEQGTHPEGGDERSFPKGGGGSGGPALSREQPAAGGEDPSSDQGLSGNNYPWTGPEWHPPIPSPDQALIGKLKRRCLEMPWGSEAGWEFAKLIDLAERQSRELADKSPNPCKYCGNRPVECPCGNWMITNSNGQFFCPSCSQTLAAQRKLLERAKVRLHYADDLRRELEAALANKEGAK